MSAAGRRNVGNTIPVGLRRWPLGHAALRLGPHSPASFCWACQALERSYSRPTINGSTLVRGKGYSTRHTSLVIRHTSYVICHTSLVIRHLSYVTRHTNRRLGMITGQTGKHLQETPSYFVSRIASHSGGHLGVLSDRSAIV